LLHIYFLSPTRPSPQEGQKEKEKDRAVMNTFFLHFFEIKRKKKKSCFAISSWLSTERRGEKPKDKKKKIQAISQFNRILLE
jgi:hypothetical protein